jgi:cytochrome P450
MAEPSIPPGFDFTDPDLTRVPMDEFAELRRTAPVWWNAQPRGASGFDDDGYWVVTRHADVLEVSRSSDLYSSQEKTAIIRHAQAVTPESLDMQRLILLNIDPPQHTKLRGIVSRGFTPRAIGRLREALTARAERIVRVAVADGTGDFVTDVAAELPLQAIAELLGIPQEDRPKIFAFLDHPVQWELFRACAARDRGRRDRPVGDPGDGVPAHRGRRHHSGWPADQNRPAGRPVLPVGQLRRGGLRRTRAVRHPAQPEPASGLRRHRDALLPRREPGPA